MGNTYYIEKNVGTKIFNDKTYLEYSQSWESGDVATLYLREENGVVLEYKEDKNEEQIRLPKTIETGKSWMLDRESVKYQILKTNGTLKTPVCKYKNLLVLKSTFQNGTFTFYYQKGYGYIGATQDNELISFAIPRLPKELMDKKKNKD